MNTTMRSVLRGAVALAAVAAIGPALAADLPVMLGKAPIDPYFNWTGFYVGGNIGGSFGYSDTTLTLGGGSVTPSSNMNGVIGGAQMGFNWQTGSWIWGLETDFQGSTQSASGDGSRTENFVTYCAQCAAYIYGTENGQESYSEKLRWFGTLRGRFGYTPIHPWFFSNQMMFYATGGLAYGQVQTSSAFTFTEICTLLGNTVNQQFDTMTSSFTNTRVGWTVGAGIEMSLWGNWTAKFEYLFVDLGSFTNSFTGLALFPNVAISSHVYDNIARFGVNYHF
jgi:outer membrane immunogenic protein